jgi:hypothetical protein
MGIMLQNKVILRTKLGWNMNKGKKIAFVAVYKYLLHKEKKYLGERWDSLLLCHMRGEGAGWNQIRGEKEKSTFGNLVTKTFCY